MRFTLLNQYYVPDLAPTGQLLHDLARTLASRGHQVDVVCSRNSYHGDRRYRSSERIGGVAVHCVASVGSGRGGAIGRLISYASFCLLAIVRLLTLTPRPDLILSLTTPPYVGLVGRWAAFFREAVHAHWVMDVYPDVMAAAGMANGKGIVMRLLRAVGRYQFRGAGLVLAPGFLVEQRLRDYAPPPTPMAAVPLWGSDFEPTDPATVAEMRHQRQWGQDLTFLYSGNMGRGHCFEEILEASRRLGPRGPIWAFVGDGARAAEIRTFARAHPDARIQVLPYVTPEKVKASLASADVHLVSLSPRWQGLILPSKLQAAFSVGRPVIFVGAAESEIGQWIAASGGGWLIGEGDVDGILKAVEQASDPAERARRAHAGLTFARAHFDRQRNCQRIAELLEGAAVRQRVSSGMQPAPTEVLRSATWRSASGMMKQLDGLSKVAKPTSSRSNL
jgi:putative colanic acid biosynthesis glycosyltransferase WcaI